ncbi:hypothetical protein HAZT_HAZT008943 [Hyalella azteca]|uniref:Sushi domain-containing protein n=1 Tax=Hyalella azteca TaxID=294128 RepID=A0A6A0GYZ1_HYAAZ|nr:hypothetical protein HAZT_HAZT008943 [Hyalella azteca]
MMAAESLPPAIVWHVAGWSLSSSERDLHYRLSVYYARQHDSGTFTCTAPSALTNSITILVKELRCAELVVARSVPESALPAVVFGRRQTRGDDRVIVAGSGTTMGSSRFFTCFDGYVLNGPQQMTCLPSVPPACEVVRCPALPPLPPLVRLRHLSLTAGGVALFACPLSYALTAAPSIVCLTNGTWSAPVPHCKEVVCPAPESPEHGSVSTAALRRVGDVAVYSCDEAFVLQGPRIVTCTNAGTWSKPKPNCEWDCVISCQSPGNPRNGRVSPRLLRYRLEAQLLVSCSPGYRPAGPDRLKCLRTGKWSAPLPPCVPVIAG